MVAWFLVFRGLLIWLGLGFRCFCALLFCEVLWFCLFYLVLRFCFDLDFRYGLGCCGCYAIAFIFWVWVYFAFPMGWCRFAFCFMVATGLRFCAFVFLRDLVLNFVDDLVVWYAYCVLRDF